MASALLDIDGDIPRCPDCLHTINVDGLNDEDCGCYCHKTLEEMKQFIQMIEERRV